MRQVKTKFVQPPWFVLLDTVVVVVVVVVVVCTH